DLEAVDRQLAEVGERRVAGAEVVDGKADAHAPQRVHRLERDVELSHQRGLGDLEGHAVGRDRMPGEDAADLVEQVGSRQVAAGQVDVHRQVVGAGHHAGPAG